MSENVSIKFDQTCIINMKQDILSVRTGKKIEKQIATKMGTSPTFITTHFCGVMNP